MVCDFVPADTPAMLILFPGETVVARHREWQAEFAEGIAQIWAWCRTLATAPLIGPDATHIGADDGTRGGSFGGGTGPVCWCLEHCADCGGWVAGDLMRTSALHGAGAAPTLPIVAGGVALLRESAPCLQCDASAGAVFCTACRRDLGSEHGNDPLCNRCFTVDDCNSDCDVEDCPVRGVR
eukprot:gene4879-7732_t